MHFLDAHSGFITWILPEFVYACHVFEGSITARLIPSNADLTLWPSGFTPSF